MTGRVILLVVVVVVVVSAMSGSRSAYAADECGDDIQKVSACLAYATGKAEEPGKPCCDSASQLKDSKPKCLCFIVLQIHNGSNPQLKTMGIQEARLIQIPSVCKLANASLTQCPKLLNIPPSSPDYAIFTNNSSSSASTTTPATSSPSSSTPDGSAGFKSGPPQLAGSLVLTLAVIFLSVFPGGGFLSSTLSILG